MSTVYENENGQVPVYMEELTPTSIHGLLSGSRRDHGFLPP